MTAAETLFLDDTGSIFGQYYALEAGAGRIYLTNSGSLDGNVLHSVSGDDDLSGEEGNDTLRGGSGDDTLEGGEECDLRVGNSGADAFVFASITDSTNNSDRDEIRYFEAADVIDLEGIVVDELIFLGSASFAGGGDAELRVRENSNGHSIVYVDTDGDGSGDMRILVSNHLGMSVSDFVL